MGVAGGDASGATSVGVMGVMSGLVGANDDAEDVTVTVVVGATGGLSGRSTLTRTSTSLRLSERRGSARKASFGTGVASSVHPVYFGHAVVENRVRAIERFARGDERRTRR